MRDHQRGLSVELDRLAQQREHPLGIGQEFPPHRRQRDAARQPFEDRTAKHGLEVADLHADRRLGAPDRLGRARDAAGLRHREEVAQKIAVECGGHVYPSEFQMADMISIRWTSVKGGRM